VKAPPKAKKSKLGPRPPKMGKDAPAPVSQKQRFRDKNTSKAGMGGPKGGAKKRLAGVML
jgi:hypothetical protein